MSESGGEERLLQGPASRQVAHALKSPELFKAFHQSIFKSQVREGESQGTYQLVHNSLTGL